MKKKVCSNYRGFWHARALIVAGKVNKVDEFNFTEANANVLLGESANDFDALSAFHLGEDLEALQGFKDRYVYPFGKDGYVYRSALEDILVQAGKSGHSAVIDNVNELIKKIDEVEQQPSVDMQISVQAAWDVKPNEIRHRLEDPENFDSCRSKDLSTGVRGIFCRLKTGNKTWKLQALRFDKDKFSLDEAKVWLKKHPITASIAEDEIDKLQTCEAVIIGNELQTSEGDFVEAGIPILASIKTKEGDGSVWDITIFKVGFAPSRPPVFISKQAIRSSLNAFKNSRVYANNDADYFGHKLDRAKKGIREIVGVIKDPYVKGDELHGSLHILPSAQWLKDDLTKLDKLNALDTYQLSIDSGYYQSGTVWAEEAKANVPNVVAVAGGDVDIVPNGAAGGKFNRMVASEGSNTNNNLQKTNSGASKMKNKLLQIFAAMFPIIFAAKNIDIVGIDENELYSHLYSANKAQPRMHLPEGYDKTTVEPILDAQLKKIQATADEPPAPPVDPPTPPAQPDGGLKAAQDALLKRMQALELQACQAELRATVAESKLPDVVQKEVMKQYEGKIFASGDLKSTIDSFKQIAAHFAQPQVDNHGMDIRITATEGEKMENALAATLLCSGNLSHPLRPGSVEMKAIVGDQTPIRSIKDLYIQCTGDREVTGNPAKMTKLLGSIDTTQFSVIVGNALNKALVSDYNQQDKLTDVNKVCNIVDLNSIQEQKRIRYGGYADAAVVAEGDAYLPATSPDDEEATYTPTKKGFTEDITLETIKKDDINAIAKIPARISKACVNKFYKSVFNLLDPGQNATIYDSVVLYHTSSHVNLGTTALATSGYLGAAVARMLAHTEAGSSDILGIRAGFLLVPAELVETAYQLVTAAYGVYNETPTYLQAQGIQVLPVPYWSGLTASYGAAAKNWALTSRREDGVPIEAGFVDGQRTPELFVSNLANVGSLFTNDKITYKVRFWFGLAVVDYRFTDGSQVS